MVVNIYGELHTFECHDPLIFLGFENKSYVNFLQNKLKQFHLNEDKLLNEKFQFLINTAIAIDSQNAKHQLNVSKLAVEIAKELNLDTLAIHRIMMSSLVHDIGKISIPKEILNKSTALRIDEILLIKNHVQTSYDILIRLLFPLDIAKVVLQHHERLDGSGYPHRLFKSEICQEAKILMVADTVESMRHSRPYRPDFNSDISLHQLEVDQYSKLPSDIVNVCTNLFRRKKFSFEYNLH
jgi:putative nucleotidyltransferase with HDIG domain